MTTPSTHDETTNGVTASAEGVSETQKAPASPTQSDQSSDSEGRPVREKLQETRIDVQATSKTTSTSDQPMSDGQDRSAKSRSTSESDSERGRLRRKRSREDFEEESEGNKQPEKKGGATYDRHARKRSRDVTKDIETSMPSKPTSTTTPTIEEVDTEMTSPFKNTSKIATPEKVTNAATSPKNKRTRDQAEQTSETTVESSKSAESKNNSIENGGEERDSKRLRDKDEAESSGDSGKATTKVYILDHFC